MRLPKKRWIFLLLFGVLFVAVIRMAPRAGFSHLAHQDQKRAEDTLRAFENAIEPEALRNWALTYLTNSFETNVVVPDVLQGRILHASVGIDVDTDNKFVVLMLGGGFEMEAIYVGTTNAIKHPSLIQVQWRPGIYYCLDR